MIRRFLNVGVGAALMGILMVPAHVVAAPPEPTRFFSGYDAKVHFNFGDEISDKPSSGDGEALPPPTIEVLPMPREDSDITCPFLRQQMIDRHACQIADPEIGRDVLANLECLKDADNLLDLAKELARCGFLTEAMMCCDLAAKRCPGSPCAARAVETLNELARGIVAPTTDTEESAEPQSEARDSEPGLEQLMCGLMKACHLLMSQGMQHQAAELARQAYALDPQRVLADPLIYKMHLLAETPTTTGSREESEPQTCPYCPSIGKPIREIVPEKKKSKKGPTTFLVPTLPPIDYEVVPALDGMLTESAGSEEASEKSAPKDIRELIEIIRNEVPIDVSMAVEGGLHLSCRCSVGDSVYHMRYRNGSLAMWKTTDASESEDGIWLEDMPSHLDPEKVHGGVSP